MDNEDKEFSEKARKLAEETVLSTQCLSCGIHYAESFAWYRKHEFECPECGGPIDDGPILEYAQLTFDRLRKLKAEQRG